MCARHDWQLFPCVTCLSRARHVSLLCVCLTSAADVQPLTSLTYTRIYLPGRRRFSCTRASEVMTISSTVSSAGTDC
jgi:hypothetical protein